MVSFYGDLSPRIRSSAARSTMNDAEAPFHNPQGIQSKAEAPVRFPQAINVVAKKPNGELLRGPVHCLGSWRWSRGASGRPWRAEREGRRALGQLDSFSGLIEARWPTNGELLRGPLADMLGSAHSNEAFDGDTSLLGGPVALALGYPCQGLLDKLLAARLTAPWACAPACHSPWLLPGDGIRLFWIFRQFMDSIMRTDALRVFYKTSLELLNTN